MPALHPGELVFVLLVGKTKTDKGEFFWQTENAMKNRRKRDQGLASKSSRQVIAEVTESNNANILALVMTGKGQGLLGESVVSDRRVALRERRRFGAKFGLSPSDLIGL